MYTEIENVSKYNTTKPVTISTKFLEKETRLLHTSYKIMVVIDGEATIKINEKEYALTRDVFINISPWTIMEINNIKKPVKYIILSYNRLYISRIINTINSKELKLFKRLDDFEYIHLTKKFSKEIIRIMLEIREEIGDENIVELSEYDFDDFTYILVVTKLISIIALISRNTELEKQKPEFSVAQSLIKYIYAHSSEKLTIMKLATIFFMSESTVRKYIENFSGLTFNELLYKIRLQKTEDLLLYTSMNLDEIAKLSGFVDGSHIMKVWNMNKSVTPSTYRQTYRNSFLVFTEEDKDKAFEIINYIRENYMKDIVIENIAKKFNITEVKVNKLLLLYIDRNFSSYLNYIRINKACELLKTTDESIIDICFKIGYNNIKTFNNNFIKYKNQTPTEFKKKEY